MRILFVQTPLEENEPAIYPLGIACLAAVLGDHDIKAVDLNIEEDQEGALIHTIEDLNPHVVGISFRNIKVAKPGAHVNCLEPYFGILKTIKKICPETILIAGGAAFSLYAWSIMAQAEWIDMGVVGEGEEIFPELLEKIDNPEQVRGVIYREDDGVYFTGHRDRPDFTSLPRPRRDVVDIRRYIRFPYSIGVQTKRGCPLGCVHCADKFLLGDHFRLRTPGDVVEEITELHDRYEIKEIFFSDQVFNMPLEHTRAILEGLIQSKLKVKWQAWFNEKFIDRDFLRLCKASGCTLLNFSPDAAHNPVLSELGKNIQVADLRRAVKLAKEVGMQTTFNFMPNGPGENIWSLLQLAKFILWAKWRLRDLLQMHGLFIVKMRIYPHTELRDIAIKRGLIEPDNDLLEPCFYNPYPLKPAINALLGLLTKLWRLKHGIKA